MINKNSSLWWRDLLDSVRLPGRSGAGWFDENLRKEVGDH